MGNSTNKGFTKQTSEPAGSKHKEQHLLNIILFGCNTGKSNWFNGSMQHQSTLGVSFKSDSFNFNNQQINAIIYDTPENIRYFNQSLQYFPTADGVILTYDTHDIQSIHHLSDCMDEIRKTIHKTTPCLLLGMQQQTEQHSQSSKIYIDDAQQLASQYDLFHLQIHLSNEIHSKHPFIYLLRQIPKLNTPQKKHNKSAQSATFNFPLSLTSAPSSLFGRRGADRLTADSEDEFKETPLSPSSRGRIHEHFQHGHIKSRSMPHQKSHDYELGIKESKRHSLQTTDIHRNAASTVVAVDISISEEHELDVRDSYSDDNDHETADIDISADFSYPTQTRNRSRHSFNIPSTLKLKRKGVIKEITPGGNNTFVEKGDMPCMSHEDVQSAMKAAHMTATGESDDEEHDESDHLQPHRKKQAKHSVNESEAMTEMKEIADDETDGGYLDANTMGQSPDGKPREGIAVIAVPSSAAVNVDEVDDDTACRLEFARWLEESLGTNRCSKYLEKFKEKQMDDIRLVDPEIFDDDWFQSGEVEMVYVDKKLFKKEVAKYKQDCVKFESSLDDIKMKDKYHKLLRNRGIATLWSFYHHVSGVRDVESIVKKKKSAMIIWKKFGNDSVRQSEGNLHFRKMMTFTLNQAMDGDKETNTSDSDEMYVAHSGPEQLTPTPNDEQEKENESNDNDGSENGDKN